MVITLGGDGLIMNVANTVADHKIPILRINFGHVGFLADVEPEDALAKIREVVEKKNYIIVKKTRLEVLVGNRGEADIERNFLKDATALNDIDIERSNTKIITVMVRILADGMAKEYIFRADGVLFFTKTGSTAYNSSAGGRPLFKEYFLGIKAVSPTCADAPDQLILKDNVVIEVELIEGKALVVADDKKIAVMAGKKIIIRKSDVCNFFIEVGDVPRMEA